MNDHSTNHTHHLLQVDSLAKHYPVSTGFMKPKALVRALEGAGSVALPLSGGKEPWCIDVRAGVNVEPAS